MFHRTCLQSVFLMQINERNLDLLLVSEEATPPVCKLVDFGQYKYQQRKKDKLSKKSSKAQVTKELKLSPKISDHDFMVRVNHAREFLTKRFKVKMSLSFRGREIVHPELGEQVAKRFIEELADLGIPDESLSRSDRSLVVFINPKTKA